MAEQSAEIGHAAEKPMPLHNLLVHVTGYVDRGCAACDWLRERGCIPAASGLSSPPAPTEVDQ